MLFLLLGFLLIQTVAAQVEITDIMVLGNFKYPDSFITNNLPFKVGSTYSSMGELAKVIAVFKNRFIHTLGYIDIDVELDEWSPGKVYVYLGLIELSTAAIESELGYIAFNNLFFYGFIGGFYVDGSLQSLALAKTKDNLFKWVLGLNNYFFENNQHGIALDGGFSYRLTPELSARLSLQYLLNFDYAFTSLNNDVMLKGNFLIDLTYLKYLYFIGPKLNLAVNQGLWESLYTTGIADLYATLHFVKNIELELRGSLGVSAGDIPPYKALNIQGAKGIRAPVTVKTGKSYIAFSAEPEFDNIINLDLKAFYLGIGLLGFIDYGRVFEGFDEIGHFADYELGYGGGLKLYFSSPISVAFCFEYGFNQARNEGQFFFIVKME